MSEEIRFPRFEFAKVLYPVEVLRGTAPAIPVCPEVTLVCDSITASKSKCGTCQDGGSPVFHGYKKCKWYCSPFGSGGRYEEEYDLSGCGTGCLDGIHYRRYYNSSDVLTCTFTSTVCNGIDGTATASPPGCSGSCNIITFPGYPIFSDEYTTGDLITNTEASLPAYSGTLGCHSGYTTGQGCLCSSFKNVSTDESSCTIRRFKYQLLFTGPNDADLDITWCERFTPEGGGAATHTNKSFHYDVGGGNNTGIYTVNEPGTDGTIDIVSIRCCALDPLTGLEFAGAEPCQTATCP